MGLSLPQLFCVAYNRGFPHSAARDVIRDLAQAMFRLPTSRLNESMRAQIAESLKGLTYDAQRDPSAASRDPQAASLCTEHLRDEIRTQASRLGWTWGVLQHFLTDRGWPWELHRLTRDQAEECLTRMQARTTGLNRQGGSPHKACGLRLAACGTENR